MIDHTIGIYVCDHCGGRFGEFNTETGNHSTCDRIAALEAENAKLREALEPFAHPDLCKYTSNNMEGDDSPVFGRDKAILTLGDFRRAAALLAAQEPA